jgi:hypothetical protein
LSVLEATLHERIRFFWCKELYHKWSPWSLCHAFLV